MCMLRCVYALILKVFENITQRTHNFAPSFLTNFSNTKNYKVSRKSKSLISLV